MTLIAQDIITEARSWLGTPYVFQASLKGIGCDCLGFIRGVWSEVTGESYSPPPPYSPDWGDMSGEELLYDAFAQYLNEVSAINFTGEKTCLLVPGDVALFRMRENGVAKHCGFVAGEIGNLTLIHTLADRARIASKVIEEPFSAGLVNRLAFGFRFKGL